MASPLSQTMLRTSALMNLSPGLLFVGVYSADTFMPLAVADRENIQMDPEHDDNQWKKLVLDLNASEVGAVVRHIRNPYTKLAEITVADMKFLCLRSKTNCLTGSACFNLRDNNETFWTNEEMLFALTNRHYTKEELMFGDNPLQLSALLREEFVFIGLCKAGTPSLKLLKEIFEQPSEQPSPASSESDSFGTGRLCRLSTNNQSYKFATETDSDVSESGQDNDTVFLSAPNGQMTKDDITVGLRKSKSVVRQRPVTSDTIFAFDEDLVNAGVVERRSTKRSKEERRRQQQNRETEFCEDWRTATVRSIEALKMIGPFTQDNVPDNDKSPLIDNREIEQNGGNSMTSPGMPLSSTQASRRRKSAPGVVRKHSRATML